jgi:gamma-glutamyltranspeptidase / glutathione hydrolase
MVAAEHHLAAEAGLAVLQAGGTAVDAAVATALAVGVVNPAACGVGGGGFMVVHHHGSRMVTTLDYRETAPAAATQEMFMHEGRAVPELSRATGLAVAVPGEIAGLVTALGRYGRLPFSVVAAPAIRYAREGFPIGSHLAVAIAANVERIRARPALAAILLDEKGQALAEGDILRQPRLARSLEEIAAGGAAAFYRGAIADVIVDSVRAAGGIMERADLEGYRPVWREPVHGRFRGYDVYGMAPPSSGGGVLIELLNMVRNDDLNALEHNSPTYLHLLAEAMQFGFADRATYYGDSDFVRVPLRFLLSSVRATRLRHRVSAAKTFPPDFYGSRVEDNDHGTSHISVIDADGNAVACTTTINTAFGSMIVAGETGIILNNEMDDFSAQAGVANAYGLVGSQANAVGPGKRPLSSMAPTIVTRDGKAVLVLGASGGPTIITSTLQTLLNILVFGQDAEAAVAAPRVHHQWLPATLGVESGIPQPTRVVLERLGHQITDAGTLGAVQVVRRWGDGFLEGAADPRKGGEARGW